MNRKEREQMRKRHWSLENTSLLVILLFIGTIVASGIYDWNTEALEEKHFQEMNKDWELEYDQSTKTVTLPYAVNSENLKPFRVSHMITEEEAAAGTDLYVVSYYCDMNIYLNGKEVGSYFCEKSREHQTQGMAYLFFDLPSNLEGQILTIEYQPEINIHTFRITEPSIGDKGHIFMHLFNAEIWDTILVLILLLMSLVLLIASLVANIQHYQSRKVLTAIGLFALNSGLYLSMNLTWLLTYLQNPILTYTIEMLTQLLLVLPMLLLLKSVTYGKSGQLVDACIWLNIIESLIQYLLYQFTPCELREMLSISHVVLVASLMVGFYVVFGTKELVDDYRKEITYAAVPVGVLGVFSALIHYISPQVQTGSYLKLGIIAFVGVEMYDTILHYKKFSKAEEENRIYREIAYKDIFTGLKNRNAYEEFCQQLEQEKDQYTSITSAVFDLNQLKHVNDTEGHAAGDMLIKHTADLLLEAFGNQNVFRTGGDEFVVVLTNMEPGEAKRIFAELEENRAKTGISYTYGISYYDQARHQDIMELIKEADNKMYEEKRKYHRIHDDVLNPV